MKLKQFAVVLLVRLLDAMVSYHLLTVLFVCGIDTDTIHLIDGSVLDILKVHGNPFVGKHPPLSISQARQRVLFTTFRPE